MTYALGTIFALKESMKAITPLVTSYHCSLNAIRPGSGGKVKRGWFPSYHEVPCPVKESDFPLGEWIKTKRSFTGIVTSLGIPAISVARKGNKLLVYTQDARLISIVAENFQKDLEDAPATKKESKESVVQIAKEFFV